MLLLRATILVLFTLFGVNSFEVKVDDKVKSQVSDQDVLESGYQSDRNDKGDYRRDVKDNDHYKDVRSEKGREDTYYRDVPYDREREIAYPRDVPYDREREIAYPRGVPNDREREIPNLRDVPYDREREIPNLRDVPNDRQREIPYLRDVPNDKEREIPYFRDVPNDREREIPYFRDLPNDRVREIMYSREMPYDKERGIMYRDLIEKNNKGNNDDKDSNYKLDYQMDYDKPFDNKTIKKLDEIFGFTGPTANDEPDNLIRPCSLNDWQCIRKYFAANSQCKPSYGPIPDPFYIEKHTIFFSAVNVTANFINFSIRGLSSAKLIDFYVNKKSGNLVFAIDVQNLNITVPRAYVRFRRTARESIVVADSAFVIFRSAIFTAVISKLPKLRLDDADIHAFVNDATPVFNYGPAFFVNPDPDILAANAEFIALLPVAIREGLVFLAPLITGIYIQENICKFDTKLISL